MEDFETVYNEYFDTVYKYLYSLSQNKQVSEDLTQETFFKALKSIDNFNGSCKISTWLCQIAKNTYFTHYKKTKQVNDIKNTEQMHFQYDFENDVCDREDAKRLYFIVHKLKEPYKEVFMLRIFGELSFRQIGEIFEKSEDWARLIFYRARKKLKEKSNEFTM